MAAIFAVLGSASSAHAQTTPTVNGLFYGDGDDALYSEYGTSSEGSKLYSYLDASTDQLYVALVISQNVNDMVCTPKANKDYTGSANPSWNVHRDCKRASDSEFAAFSLTCGATTYTWNQALGCAQTAGPPESNWVSSTVCGPSSDIWPPGLVASTSFVANINTYQMQYPYPATTVPWDLYTFGTDRDEWKSPFVSTAPDDVTAVPGYPNFTTYDQLLSGEPNNEVWEWSMVYEWSVDVSGCGDNTVAYWPTNSHHSPPKSGVQDEPWYDWGDLPDTYATTAMSDGPRHLLVAGGPTLGGIVDPEQDGIPSVAADGDNSVAANDERGVVFLEKFVSGDTADIQVTVTDSDGTAYLSAWIDFDGDGVLEAVTLSGGGPVSDLALTSGIHTLTINVPNVAIVDSLAARFRLTDDPNQYGSPIGPPSPTGVASNGEVEDYIVDNTTLSITISYFLAELDGDMVSFVWQTATETGNAGFNLFAETDGGLVELNDELIPSTVIDSVTPTDYSYEAVTSATTFYIEEVSIAGSTNREGPFTLGVPAGAYVEIDADPAPFTWLPMISN